MRSKGIDSHACVLIGDTDHDIEVAEAMGVDVIILADGHQSYSRLAGKHPNIIPSRYQIL